jgi:hypothetical protein
VVPGARSGHRELPGRRHTGWRSAASSPLSPGGSGPQTENQVNCCCEYCRKDYGRQPFLAPELHNFALQKCNSFHPCKYCLQPAKRIPRHTPLYTPQHRFAPLTGPADDPIRDSDGLSCRTLRVPERFMRRSRCRSPRGVQPGFPPCESNEVSRGRFCRTPARLHHHGRFP